MSIEKTIKPEVVKAIESELIHQRAKWGSDKEQSLAGFLLIMQHELNEAIDGWMKERSHRNSCLSEIVQVVTTGICALNYYGTCGSAESTNDLTESEKKEARLKNSDKFWLEKKEVSHDNR